MKFVNEIAVLSGGKSVKPVLPAAGTGNSVQRQPAPVCQLEAVPAIAALFKLNRSARVAMTESRTLMREGLLCSNAFIQNLRQLREFSVSVCGHRDAGFSRQFAAC